MKQRRASNFFEPSRLGHRPCIGYTFLVRHCRFLFSFYTTLHIFFIRIQPALLVLHFPSLSSLQSHRYKTTVGTYIRKGLAFLQSPPHPHFDFIGSVILCLLPSKPPCARRFPMLCHEPLAP